MKQNVEDLFVYGFTSYFECCVRCINQARILAFLHASGTPFASVRNTFRLFSPCLHFLYIPNVMSK